MTRFKPLVTAMLAGAAVLMAGTPNLHGQVRGRPMQMGMMARPSMFFPRPMTSGNTTTTNTTMQINPNAMMSARMSPFFSQQQRLAHQRFLQMRAFYMGGRAAAYGMSYGSAYGAGSYGMPYYGAYSSPYTSSYSAAPSYRSYTREYSPEPAALRPATEQDQLERSRNNPPIGEILSGRALNDILADLRRMAADNPTALPAADLPLDQAGLAHINVTRGSGNIGLLKRGTDLVWPTALRGPEFQEFRITARLRAAVKQAEAEGRVDLDLTGQLADDVDRLGKDFRRTAAVVAFDQHVEAKKFLKSLDEAVVALQQTDVGSYFNGKFALKATTIPDLVKQMADNGLQFAPAAPGDDRAYTALHQSLAAYDRTVSDRKPPANDRQPAEQKKAPY